MKEAEQGWGERLRSGFNGVLDRIAEFEMEGGVSGALHRGVERLRQEQERLRREITHQGPLAYQARVRQAYARLELPYGSDRESVRKAYRRLMRRYHPDRHTGDPRREQIATEISQKLTDAYDLLCEYLGD
ncbi:MAG: J domain-containing protein [Bradymonadales bacterium]|nr:J domain-containing protein [Bradymonadales bacterium]